MDGFLLGLTFVTALGCALNGGILFAFSSFVMKGLAGLPAPQGVAAMQSINVAAVTPVFMTSLFGTAALCAVVSVWGLVGLGEDYGPYLLAGGLVYLVGVIGLTMRYHVPRNNALAAAEPGSAEAEQLWARYLREWTGMNHVRSAAGVVAAALLIVAMLVD